MTVSSGNGNGSKPLQQRPLTITNPYLKKRNASAVAPPSKPINPPAVTPLKNEPSGNRPPTNSVQAGAQTRPEPANSSGINRVTPTPNKALKPTEKRPVPISARGKTVHNTGQLSNTAVKEGNALKAAHIASAIRKGATPKTAPISSHPNKPSLNKAQSRTKSISLKSQLKSQIALLKTQKKQHIQQKERARLEAERKAREVELTRLQKEKDEVRERLRLERERKMREEEIERAQKRMERERIKEDKIRKREVGVCLTHVLKRVELRLGWERKSGKSYEVGEAVAGLVREVERRNEVKCVGHGYGFGGMISSFPQQRIMQSVQSLHHVQRNGLADPWPYRGVHLQPFIQTQSMPLTHSITKPQQPRPKPLILHSNPLDQYSPFRESYYTLDKMVCMTKRAGESFGITLRWECRSVLVPREEEVDAKMGTGGIKEASISVSLANGNGNAIAAPSINESQQHGNLSVLALTTNNASGTATGKLAAAGGATNIAALPSQTFNSQKPRKKRRLRVNYGVITVMTVSKATFVFASEELKQNVSSVPELNIDDIILAVNGRNVGGLTFAEACKVLSETSVEDVNGIIRCNLKVARRVQATKVNAPQGASLVNVGIGYSIPGSRNANTNTFNPSIPGQSRTPDAASTHAVSSVSLTPFVATGDKVISGEFSSVEWQALVRSLSSVHRELATGMALQPVPLSDILDALKDDKTLQHRSIDALKSKLKFEGEKVMIQMATLAKKHWTTVWKLEVDADSNNENNALFQELLTDAERSVLRSLARPLTGCRCGSMTHEFVNDTKCVLYRNVKAFLVSDNLASRSGGAAKAAKHSKARNALEAAYIERFIKFRAETEAAKTEAEFVLNMEIKQSSEMNKAVFAPSSLCTMVLSAIASIAEVEADDDNLSLCESSGEGASNDEKNKKDADDDSDDEEEDLPLNLLAPNTKKIKRDRKKEIPNTHFLAKILVHISKTYGHLFQEPSHVEYAWQQRHRSNVTTPLSREVMFKGNPRKPGNLSFENIQFLFSDDRMIRLQNAEFSDESLTDEWIVTYLSSDEVTGLRHEIDVLESIGLVEIKTCGKVSLTPNWKDKVPHILLNEMMESWAAEIDVHNLHCVHKMIRSLSKHWEYVDDDGWVLTGNEEATSEERDLKFDNEEYNLRKQIFCDNFDSYKNGEIGVGDFGC